MEPCTQEERIERIEKAVEKITDQIGYLAADFGAFKAKMDSVLDSVAEHDRALKGNNGTIGLIAKVANALEVLSDLQEALRGKGEKPGLIATIDKLAHMAEGWENTKKWAGRLVAGWLVTTVLMILFEVLRR